MFVISMDAASHENPVKLMTGALRPAGDTRLAALLDHVDFPTGA
jgi:hypothetical protein